MSKLISIFGQLSSGKDCLADYLVNRLNERQMIGEFSRSAFANAVKKVYQDAFGVDRDFVEKWKRIPEPPPGMNINVRKGLQFIGDGFRRIKSDIWIEIALRDKRNLCISDGRYINEAIHVRQQEGVNIILWRQGFENNDPNPSESQILPIVQWCLDTNRDGPLCYETNTIDGVQYYDYFMRNDGTLEEFYQKIDQQLVPWLENHMNV